MSGKSPSDERETAPKWLRILLQATIIYSLLTMTLETMPELAGLSLFFEISEIVIVIIFTAEYVGFWIVAKDKWRYPFRPFSIIDLLAILPFYLQLGVDLRGARALRLIRIVRVLKLAKHSSAMDTLMFALKRSAPGLTVTGVITLIALWMAAAALYYAEHEAQPEVYSSIPAAFWSAVVTLTTVGYGDTYPITPLGKVICVSIMLIGIGVVAVPTGLISSHLTELLREEKEKKKDRLRKSVHFRED